MENHINKMLVLKNGNNKEEKYICKLKYDNSSYDFVISTLSQIWKQKLKESDIAKLNTLLNPRLAAPTASIISHIEKSLRDLQNSPEELQTGFDNGNLRSVTLKNKFKGVPFTWRFDLEELDSSSIVEYIVTPLYTTLAAIIAEKNELVELVKRKDEEIKDYKENGAKVTKTYLETLEFDKDDFGQDWRNSYDYAKIITKPTFTLAADEELNSAMDVVLTDKQKNDIIDLAEDKVQVSPNKLSKFSPQKTKRLPRKAKRQLPGGVKLESSDSDTDIEKDMKKPHVNVHSKVSNTKQKTVKSKKKSILKSIKMQ